MIGRIIQNKYEVLREIGRGGMSVVYLVKDWKLETLWAMKVMVANIPQNDDEFQLLKQLNHAGLPRIVDRFWVDNQQAIVMDYIEGDTLQHCLTYRSFSQKDVVEIAKQLCDILHYLHTRNPSIIFQDLKPSNIVLLPNGMIKLIDLGIAQLYGRSKQTEHCLGTKGFAAPEQCRGQATTQSDIYGLGMTLHYLLTLANPQENDYQYRTIRYYNKHYTKQLSDIIDRCTKEECSKRFNNCLCVKQALERIGQRKIAFRRTFLYSSLALCVGYGGVHYWQTNHVDRQYAQLIQQGTKQSVLKAIQLQPQRIEAYEQLLYEMMADNHFSPTEQQQLLLVLKRYYRQLDRTHFKTQQFLVNCCIQLLGQSLSEHVNLWQYVLHVDHLLQQLHTQLLTSQLTSKEQQVLKEQVSFYATMCHFYRQFAKRNESVLEPTTQQQEQLLLTIKNVLQSDALTTFDQLLLSQLFLTISLEQKEQFQRNDTLHTHIKSILTAIQQFASLHHTYQQQAQPLHAMITKSLDTLMYYFNGENVKR